MKSKKIVQVLVGVLILSVIVVPFIFKNSYAQGRKDTLIIGVPVSASGIDPDFNSGPEEWDILGNVSEAAVRWPLSPYPDPAGKGIRVPDFKGVEPLLWESWKISPDQKTVTVKLRKGVRSNFGNELTSRDAYWTYQRWFAMKAIGKFFLDTSNISSIDNIKIIDDYTFSLTADRATPMILGVHFVSNHAGYHDSTEMKKHATEKDPWAMEWCKNHNATFGPYQVTEWKAGDRIVLDVNPNYYKGAPAIKKIIRKVIPESFSRVSMLRAGTIDVARALTPKEIDSLQGAKGVKVINIPGNMCNMLFMNSKFKPWDNKLVRKAVSYAIPRDEIIKTAMYGYGRPMTSIGPSMYPMASSKNDFPYSYQPSKAKALLKEAGFPNGFDCELTYNPLYPPDEVAATIIKTRLSEVGINVNLKKIPYGTFFTELYRREIPFGFQTIQPFHPDAFYGLTLQWITNGFDNVYSYSDKEIDKLIEDGRGITDMEERTKAGRAIMKKVMDDAPVVWILERNYTYPMRDNVMGWNWTTWEGTYHSEVTLK